MATSTSPHREHGQPSRSSRRVEIHAAPSVCTSLGEGAVRAPVRRASTTYCGRQHVVPRTPAPYCHTHGGRDLRFEDVLDRASPTVVRPGALEHLAPRPGRSPRHHPPAPLRWLAERVPTGCGPTRPRPSTWPGPDGPWQSPPARRSGKSLCYQLPIAEAVARPHPAGTALALWSTHQGAGPGPAPGARPAVRARAGAGHLRRRRRRRDQRTWARRHANVILTNPEMLHAGCSPTTPGGPPSSCASATS